ncbi:DUF4919 domain-containing protein [bacterium]|nr:DUF4919 domain-containing protein [bacterium]
MKAPLFIILALFLLVPDTKADTISNIDFTSIEAAISDSNGDFFYPKLMQKLRDRDTSISTEEYQHIYFGQVFQDNYAPYGIPENFEKIRKYWKKGKLKTVMELCREDFNSKPTDLRILDYMISSCMKWDMTDSLKIYRHFYHGMIKAIIASGDGKSIETAMVVASPRDEYQVLYYWGLKSEGQALIRGTDRLTISKDQPRIKGQKKIKELYFNIKYPFGSLIRGLIKKNVENDSTSKDSSSVEELEETMEAVEEAAEAADEAMEEAGEEDDNDDGNDEGKEPEEGPKP